jgi:tRNA G10  N-methylase Trm11
MSSQQLEVYNQILKSENTYAWTNESQISNFIYNTYKESKATLSICYGSQGFNNIIIPKKGKKDSYRFKDEEYGKRFLGDELKKYSSKIHKLMNIIKETTKTGPVFIYTNFIHSGIIPLILTL